MSEVEALIPYLYSYDAREAAARLVALGQPAVMPLIAVIEGQYVIADLSYLTRAGNSLPACIAVPAEPALDAARERAAYVLGDIGDARAVEALIAAYGRERDRYIRLAVARALGKIGDPRGVDVLIDALAGRPWTPDFVHLVNDLARIGGESAVEPLIGLIRREDYTYGSAARAAAHLALHRDHPRAVIGLTGGLRLDAEFATVQAVTAALGEMGGTVGVCALLDFIREMMALPPERWDEREDNLSETDQGVAFHILKTEFHDAASAVRRAGDAEASAALDRLLAGAPSYLLR